MTPTQSLASTATPFRKMPGAQSGYSPEIDGLRAIAVLAVIINHFNAALLPSGHLGVDIFFVISGYVITASLAKRHEPSFFTLLSGFYVRRVKRLIPALAVSVLATALLISLFDPNPAVSLKTGISALFGASNLYLYRQSTDYFGGSAALNAFTQTWSLGVEEQFYLTFPLLIWLTGIARRSRGKATFGWVVGIFSAAALVLFVYLVPRNPSAAFYMMPSRLWELGAGCLVYVLVADPNRAKTAIRRLPSLPLLVTLAGTLFIPAHSSAATSAAIVLQTALLVATLQPDTLAYRILSSRAAVYVGRISYSLYLWHWSVVVLGRWTIGIHWWTIPFQAALMFLLAHLSFRYIERPLRSADWASSRLRTIGYGFGASLTVALALLPLAKPLNGRLYAGTKPPLLSRGVETLLQPYRMPGTRWVWDGPPCVLSDNSEVGKAIDPASCTLGDFATATRRVLVVGNSFSASFTSAFDELVVADAYAVTITSSWGASPAPQVPNDSRWQEANAYYWAHVVPDLESRLRPGDLVFAVSNVESFSPEQPSPERVNSLDAALRSWSARLAQRSVRLVVMDGIPFANDALCEPESATPQWFAPFGGPCTFFSRSQTQARRAPLHSMLSTLQQERVLFLVDLLDVFCPASICTYTGANGEVLYRDASAHPSVEAARLAAPTIRNILKSAGATATASPLSPSPQLP